MRRPFDLTEEMTLETILKMYLDKVERTEEESPAIVINQKYIDRVGNEGIAKKYWDISTVRDILANLNDSWESYDELLANFVGGNVDDMEDHVGMHLALTKMLREIDKTISRIDGGPGSYYEIGGLEQIEVSQFNLVAMHYEPGIPYIDLLDKVNEYNMAYGISAMDDIGDFNTAHYILSNSYEIGPIIKIAEIRPNYKTIFSVGDDEIRTWASKLEDVYYYLDIENV